MRRVIMVKKCCQVVRTLLPLVVAFGPDCRLGVAQDLAKTPPPDGLVAKGTAAVPAAVVCFLEGPAVYRIDDTGKVKRMLTQKEIDRPNGIAVSPDGKTLYVIDSHPKEGGNRKIWAFDLAADGSLSKQRVLYDFGKGRGGDGMRVAMNGNLWVAAGINKPRGNPGESLDV